MNGSIRAWRRLVEARRRRASAKEPSPEFADATKELEAAEQLVWRGDDTVAVDAEQAASVRYMLRASRESVRVTSETSREALRTSTATANAAWSKLREIRKRRRDQ